LSKGDKNLILTIFTLGGKMIQLKTVLAAAAFVLLSTAGIAGAADKCVECHTKVSPGMVADWKASEHSKNDVTCSTCHGDAHSTAEDFLKAKLPNEAVCAECHEEQFESFKKGKHNFGWAVLNAIPATHMAPDELMEGGRGCGLSVLPN
jgi:predicted CXXCH cytochrome family protein